MQAYKHAWNDGTAATVRGADAESLPNLGTLRV